MGRCLCACKDVVASGYAAIWATENTRVAIFDAMKCKQTYATTGPGMLAQFFGGWVLKWKVRIEKHRRKSTTLSGPVTAGGTKAANYPLLSHLFVWYLYDFSLEEVASRRS